MQWSDSSTSSSIIKQFQAENLFLRELRIKVESDIALERDHYHNHVANLSRELTAIEGQRQVYESLTREQQVRLRKAEDEIRNLNNHCSTILKDLSEKLERQSAEAAKLEEKYKSDISRLQIEACRAKACSVKALDSISDLQLEKDALRQQINTLYKRSVSSSPPTIRAATTQTSTAIVNKRDAITQVADENNGDTDISSSSKPGDKFTSSDVQESGEICAQHKSRARVNDLMKENATLRKQLQKQIATAKNYDDDLAMAESQAANYKEKLVDLQLKNSELRKLNVSSQRRIRELEYQIEHDMCSEEDYSDEASEADSSIMSDHSEAHT